MNQNKREDNQHDIALQNFTQLFKYKHHSTKCIGLIIRHEGEYFDLDWCYIDGEWEYDRELEILIDQEKELFGEPVVKNRPSYRELYSKS